jgi:hypothetical protein
MFDISAKALEASHENLFFLSVEHVLRVED